MSKRQHQYLGPNGLGYPGDDPSGDTLILVDSNCELIKAIPLPESILDLQDTFRLMGEELEVTWTDDEVLVSWTGYRQDGLKPSHDDLYPNGEILFRVPKPRDFVTAYLRWVDQ